MCYSGNCIRELENGGTCKDPRKCAVDELEAQKDDAFNELDSLRDVIRKAGGQISEALEKASRFSTYSAVRDFASSLNDALEDFKETYMSAVQDAKAEIG